MKGFKKILSLIFKLEILVFLLGVLLNPQKAVNYFRLNEILQSGNVSAQNSECLLPSCFPIKLPELPCFPHCLPGCPTPTPEMPKPTPTEVFPGVPVPTSPPPPSGGNEGGVGGPQGGGESPHCGEQTPAAPHLKNVTKINLSEVELDWDPVEPVTHYSISYGSSSGNYLYGVPNTGKVTSFKVGALGSGNYCFVVRGVNNCAPGVPSNEICTGGGVQKVLGASVLGATGDFENQLCLVLFIIGCVCTSVGLSLACPVKKSA